MREASIRDLGAGKAQFLQSGQLAQVGEPGVSNLGIIEVQPL